MVLTLDFEIRFLEVLANYKKIVTDVPNMWNTYVLTPPKIFGKKKKKEIYISRKWKRPQIVCSFFNTENEN